MSNIVSFGEWVQRRRNRLNLSRVGLAQLVGCSPVTIKKIERDERRPSVQIAELLAQHLLVPDANVDDFVRRARGEFVARLGAPTSLGLDEEDTLTFLSSPQHAEELPPLPSLDRFKIMARLEALPDQKLFGVEQTRQTLIDALSNSNRPWLVSIEGLGGIGKTSLANEVVHHFLTEQRFVDIGWISAKQEEYVTGRGVQPTEKAAINADTLVDMLLAQLADGPYPVESSDAKRAALHQILQEKQCLIVIDNLETAADYLRLLPLLRLLAQPTKFLITSRMSLQNETDVFCQRLHELDEQHALEFLRYEATLQSVGPLIAASDPELQEIYATVGGNPLALKLVIGQAHFLPLEHILTNLQQAREAQVDQLYEYIYWQAWQMLDESGRQLLLSLPIVPNGTFSQLSLASKLNSISLQQALTSLRALSLIEVGGELQEPRYRLHRLTETFLMNEVVHWQTRSQQVNASPEGKYFADRVHSMVNHWQESPAIQQLDIATLDQEKEGILKALQLGLASNDAWPIVKTLIYSLTNYMERRGHWQEWRQTLDEAIEIAQKLNESEDEIRLTILRGRILQRQNNADEVIDNYRRVIRLARQAGNRMEEARACSNLGFAYIEKGNWWRSKLLLCHALDVFDDIAYQHGQAHTHNHLGLLFLASSEWEESNHHLQNACRIWLTLDDRHGLVFGYQNLGFLYNKMEQPKVATGYLEQSLDYLEKTGEQGQLPLICLNLAVSYQKSGESDKAEIMAKRSEAGFQAQRDLLGVYKSWEVLGLIYQQLQQENKAKYHFDAALEGYRDRNFEEGIMRVEEFLTTFQTKRI